MVFDWKTTIILSIIASVVLTVIVNLVRKASR